MTRLLLSIAVGVLACALVSAAVPDQARMPRALPIPVVEDEEPPDLGDLNSLPRIESISQFTYVGSFRGTNTFTTSYGRGCDFTNAQVGHVTITMGTDNSKLFAHSETCIHEMTIPALVTTGDPSAMNMAGIAQAWADPGEGQIGADLGTTDPYRLGSMLVHNGRLVLCAFIFYDANNIATKSCFARSTNLSTVSYPGDLDMMWANLGSEVGVPDKGHLQGFVANAFIPVPAQWQIALGSVLKPSKALAHGSCMSIASRTSSNGPSALGFDPDDVSVAAEPIHMFPLMYMGDLGPPTSTDPEWNNTTCITGGVIFENTRTLMFYGTHGTGAFCYGGVQTPEDMTKPCVDPEDSASGNHAYPYVYQLYFYDLLDLAAVNAGTRTPQSVQPYLVEIIHFETGDYPTGTARTSATGIAYDPTIHRLYFGQGKCWPRVDSWPWPCFHAYDVDTTP